jgi:hypothetical protein
MSLCLQLRLLLALQLGAILLACILSKQGSQTSSVNDFTKDIAHYTRKKYVNIDLELFFISKLDIYFVPGSMWDIRVSNPGQSCSDHKRIW